MVGINRSDEIIKDVLPIVNNSLAVWKQWFRVGYDDDCIREVRNFFMKLGFKTKLDKKVRKQYCSITHKTETYIVLTISNSNAIYI